MRIITSQKDFYKLHLLTKQYSLEYMRKYFLSKYNGVVYRKESQEKQFTLGIYYPNFLTLVSQTMQVDYYFYSTTSC